MIVDGLGHVSLDSGTNVASASAVNMPAVAANIHQGSIPATGRKAGAGAASSSQPTTPLSAPNSLPLNQLIGGAVSPNLVNAAAGQSHQGLNLSTGGANPNLMIGDYMQGNMGTMMGQGQQQQPQQHLQQQQQATFKQ